VSDPADVGANPGPSGLTRRETLKRGAVAGAALVWTTPIVQALSMDAAHADPASGGQKGSSPTPSVLPTKIGPSPDVLGGKKGPGDSELPYTGSDTGRLGALGLGMVATGAALGVVAAAARKGRQHGKHAPNA
jgi:hypothetical protein